MADVRFGCISGSFKLLVAHLTITVSARSHSLIYQYIHFALQTFLAPSSYHLLIIQLQQCVSRVQFLESSTVGRSIVSKQEARLCDLENKLEFQRGQVKRFEVRADNSFLIST